MQQRHYKRLEGFQDWLSGYEVNDSAVTDAQAEYEQAEKGIEQNRLDEANERMARQAAAESVAIEGFYSLERGESRSVAASESGWQEILTRDSDIGLALFESHLNGLHYSIEHLNSGEPVTEAFIRELHQVVCSSQETYSVYTIGPDGQPRSFQKTLEKGVYKTHPNNVTRGDGSIFWYAPVEDVSSEMQAFVSELQSDHFTAAHPLAKIAYSHYGLTYIHPFSDGNGRVARALASLFSLYTYRVPLVVYSDRKQNYYQALEMTTRGNISELISHVTDRTIATLEAAAQELRSISQKSTSDSIDELVEIISLHQNVSVQDIRAVGADLATELSARIINEATRRSASGKGAFTIQASTEAPTIGDRSHPARNRSTKDYGHYMENYPVAPSVTLSVSIESPAKVGTNFAVQVTTAGPETRFCFRISLLDRAKNGPMSGGRATEDIYLTYEDCFPSISASASDRIDLFVDSMIRRATLTAKSKLEDMLRQAGRLNS
ncbi:Fic family protein [Lentzea chajnantorensis]